MVVMGMAECTCCHPSNANLLGVLGRVGGAGETKSPLTQNVFEGFIAMPEIRRPEPRRVLLQRWLLLLPAGVRPEMVWTPVGTGVMQRLGQLRKTDSVPVLV